MNWTESQMQYYLSSVGRTTNSHTNDRTKSCTKSCTGSHSQSQTNDHANGEVRSENPDAKMFIPSIPLQWAKAAMEATKGRGAATIMAVWLESKLQTKKPFSIRKRITEKIGLSKKARQTMAQHLRMMDQAGLVELTSHGKRLPLVKILKSKSA